MCDFYETRPQTLQTELPAFGLNKSLTSWISVSEFRSASISAPPARGWRASSTALYVSGPWSYISSLSVRVFQSFSSTSGWWVPSTLLCSCHFPSTERRVNCVLQWKNKNREGKQWVQRQKGSGHPFESFSRAGRKVQPGVMTLFRCWLVPLKGHL